MVPQSGGDFSPPPGFPSTELRMPTRGAFAMSETVPLIQQYAAKMQKARDEWHTLRVEANEKKALAKKVRADLIVQLRVFGLSANGDRPIKTSAERNEWADADADVQQAELEADLAQTVQMSAHDAYDEAVKVFDTIQSLMGIERDDMKRGYGGPQFTP